MAVKIKVLLADDSVLVRQVLTDRLTKSGSIEVVGAAKNGAEAIDMVKKLKPEILILDCEMPVMNGLEALRHIMKDCPLPVFMFSSLTSEGAAVTIKAMEYGAVDYLLKPTSGEAAFDDVVKDLVMKLRHIHLKSTLAKIKPEKKTIRTAAEKKAELAKIKSKKIDLIVMGSSTGGVQAAMTVVPNLPAQMKPIVWVQHMPPHFTTSFAERLASISKIKVKEAENNELVQDNHCYLAPGGQQMRVVKQGMQLRIKLGENEKVGGHCPACNVLFDSVHEIMNENVLGIILTGMGEDGANGLKKLHDKGAYVIGQDEESAVVYGMPKAAFDKGAVDVQLPLADIAEGVQRVLGLKT